MRRIAALAVSLGFAIAGSRSHSEEPTAADWRAAAKAAGLSDDAVDSLARDGFVVAGRPMAQVFDAYVDVASEQPVFVTSDSILNGYHVLLGESLLRIEVARAPNVGPALRRIYDALPEAAASEEGPAALVEAGRARAAAVLSVALALLGDPPAEMAPDVADVVRLVETGEGRGKPKWLGPPDPGFLAIDYARFRPRGMYVRSGDLERHFRAWTWLQSVPFRPAIEVEVAAAVLLVSSRQRAFDGVDRLAALLSWTSLLPSSDPSLLAGYPPLPNDLAPASLAAYRSEPGLATARTNDLLAARAEPSLRLISPADLPDAALFQDTSGARGTTRWPDALEVCAMLGDPWASERLHPISPALARARTTFGGESAYERHLRCLAALLDPPEPEAPAFVRGEAWSRKRCGTVLAAWAQQRRHLALAARETTRFFGEPTVVPGFVEPDPEFFARFGALVRTTASGVRHLEEELGTTDGVVRIARRGMASDLRVLARAIEERLPAAPDADGWRSRPPEEHAAIGRALRVIHPVDWARTAESGAWRDLVERCVALARDLESDRPLDEVDVGLGDLERPLAPLWADLETLAHRFEALAHKQLRGAPLTEEDAELLRGYGRRLAHVMLYESSTYIWPADDAPRAASVFHDPAEGRHWVVGIGRPRRIFVRYPYGGRDRLCVGGVLPYLETTSPRPPTDDEWRGLLHGGGAESPQPPEWLLPVFADDAGAAPTRR